MKYTEEIAVEVLHHRPDICHRKMKIYNVVNDTNYKLSDLNIEIISTIRNKEVVHYYGKTIKEGTLNDYGLIKHNYTHLKRFIKNCLDKCEISDIEVADGKSLKIYHQRYKTIAVVSSHDDENILIRYPKGKESLEIYGVDERFLNFYTPYELQLILYTIFENYFNNKYKAVMISSDISDDMDELLGDIDSDNYTHKEEIVLDENDIIPPHKPSQGFLGLL